MFNFTTCAVFEQFKHRPFLASSLCFKISNFSTRANQNKAHLLENYDSKWNYVRLVEKKVHGQIGHQVALNFISDTV